MHQGIQPRTVKPLNPAHYRKPRRSSPYSDFFKNVKASASFTSSLVEMHPTSYFRARSLVISFDRSKPFARKYVIRNLVSVIDAGFPLPIDLTTPFAPKALNPPVNTTISSSLWRLQFFPSPLLGISLCLKPVGLCGISLLLATVRSGWAKSLTAHSPCPICGRSVMPTYISSNITGAYTLLNLWLSILIFKSQYSRHYSE